MARTWLRRSALLAAVLIIPACGGGSGGGGGGVAATPAAPTVLAATPGDTQVALSWIASAGATSYNVYRATVSGGAYANVANVAVANHTDPGLANGTPYFYIVRAVNAVGESANSNEATATPVPPPSAPTGLTATPGNTQVALTWNASATATSYTVHRGTTTTGPYSLVATVAVTNHPDTGLTNGTAYFYVVRAVNGSGESGNSTEASATPIPPPPAPTGLAATPGDTQVALTWNASAGATSYSVHRGTTTTGPYSFVATVGVTNYTNTGLTNGTTYYFVVTAANGSGTSPNSNESPASPLPPPLAPTGLTATWGNTQVSLTWTASATATSYTVHRGTATTGPYSLVATVGVTNHTDTGLTNGTTYFYVVRAVNSAGPSGNSTEVSGAPATVPAAPTGLAATPGNSQIGLSWNSLGGGVTGYRVDRSLAPGGPYTIVTTVAGTVHTDTGLSNGTTYYYVVRGVNGSVVGPVSNEASATPASGSGFSKARGLDDLTWAVAPDGSGKVYAGGTMRSFGTQAVSGVVRINSNGTLDTGFSPPSFGTGHVRAILPLASGKVIVGGEFLTPATRIARLNPDGTLDNTFVTGAGFLGQVNALALAPDGSGDIYAGGNFTSYDGITRNRLVRLNDDGSVDATFTTAMGTAFSSGGASVQCIVPATDGSNDVYVGGQFSQWNGAAVNNNIIRIDNAGTRDAGFAASAGAQVNAIALAADASGDIFFAGAFASRVARVDSGGIAIPGFAITGAGFNDVPLALLAAGTDVYVGGWFSVYATTPVGRIVRLNGDGSLDAGFAAGTGFNERVHAFAADGSGGLFAVGGFTAFNGVGVDRLTQVNAVGTIVGMPLGSGFGAGLTAQVFDVAFVPATTDVYVGGSFTHYDGFPSSGLARLNSDGTVDSTLVIGAGFQGPVITMALSPSGDLYCGGGFTAYKSIPVSPLIRLFPNGTRDTTFAFTTGFDGNVNTIILAPDGSGDIIVGGLFDNYNGTLVNKIVRLSPTGGIVAFATGTAFNGAVRSLAIGPSNTVYVGGSFTDYNGTTLNGLVRLHLNGTIDAGFVMGTGLNGTGVTKLLADGSDGVYVSGEFNLYKGATRWRLARVDANGDVNGTFVTPGFGFNSPPLALALASGGDLYAGGTFTTFNGGTVRPVVRLNSNATLDAGFPATVATPVPGFVQALGMLPDASGRLYIGGGITTWAGTTIDYFARLTAAGAVE